MNNNNNITTLPRFGESRLGSIVSFRAVRNRYLSGGPCGERKIVARCSCQGRAITGFVAGVRLARTHPLCIFDIVNRSFNIQLNLLSRRNCVYSVPVVNTTTCRDRSAPGAILSLLLFAQNNVPNRLCCLGAYAGSAKRPGGEEEDEGGQRCPLDVNNKSYAFSGWFIRIN